MLFAPALADRAILPTAWGGRYFFNRIGRLPPLKRGRRLPRMRRSCRRQLRDGPRIAGRMGVA
ncbi:hypothetical protein IPC98_12965 [Pseudomonas aeruginosa]|nr:hypothetical protein IPC98_12965 [Pseudomonas aeruginosa]